MKAERLVIVIEHYKLAAGLVFSLLILAIAMPLMTALRTMEKRQLESPASSGDFISAALSNVDGTAYAAPLPGNYGSSVPAPEPGHSWPMPGRITTEFGVPHRPWQHVHTGIDITSARPSGVAAVHPFKAGIVVDTVRSGRGYGNHVIVDHGGGITSLYGHLAGISVAEGQLVAVTTTLGYEGSTGTSTGPHVHFEVRRGGKPIDPRQFLVGNP